MIIYVIISNTGNRILLNMSLLNIILDFEYKVVYIKHSDLLQHLMLSINYYWCSDSDRVDKNPKNLRNM